MKVLFVGGNGNISWHCVNEALLAGHDVWEINRSQTLDTRRDIQSGVHKITADIHNVSRSILNDLRDSHFDVVINFICFDERDAREAVVLFAGITDKYIHISSESVYKRKSEYLPFKETCEKISAEETDEYVAGKVQAEKYFRTKYEQTGFPVTVIRPCLTYDTIVPVCIGHNCFTAPQKFLDGYPALIAGDGDNLITLTHSRDFAKALIPLIEIPEITGEDFHIASTEWTTWDEAMRALFVALGLNAYDAIHIPFAEAIKIKGFQSEELLKQRFGHNIYDVSKIKKWIPKWNPETRYADGIKETIAWLNEKSVRRRIVPSRNETLDALYAKYMR